ncbi:MAG: hypothetical protein A2Y14_01295 [Verrucomicrobia bacterium GWF2_51_19]|nr:MAG: hypothetical protein A2Y14_01295 [Verrucomicrobia bacterium GWF2_51_19]
MNMNLFKDYLRIPSISAQKEHVGDMRRAADFLKKLFVENDFGAEIVETGGHPVVFAEKRIDAEAPTLLFYGHYDVQPVDPIALWQSDPFEPDIRNGKIYARGASDNKGSHLSMLLGLFRSRPKFNLKCVIEGEEEIGSVHFESFLKANRERLACDLVVLSDTGCISEEQIVITTGLRGLLTFEVELTGPTRDLHSGVYGGAVDNPIRALTALCASLHTDDSRVDVEGFYDGIIPPSKAEVDVALSLDCSQLQHDAGRALLPFPQSAIRFSPTLEFNGICGGYTGEGSKTIIPQKASVKISCRLVPGQDAVQVFSKVQKALVEHCPKTMTLRVFNFQGGNPYFLNTADLPVQLQSLLRKTEGLLTAFGKKPLYLREGGSIGIVSAFRNVLGVSSLMVGLSLPQDNLHAPNESFSLKIFEKAADFYRAFVEED